MPQPQTLALLAGLEDHAATLGLTPERYTRPATWPSRMRVPASFVVPGRWQPRSVFVDAEISDLADSIRVNGIINPLIVFISEAGTFELIAGERRLRAAGIVGLMTVPVEVIEGTPAQLQELSLVDNIQRANLRPWEEGTAFEKMLADQQISEAELARRMGKNRAYIQQRRALAGAAPALIEALAGEDITQSMARGILAGAGDLHAAQQIAVKEVRNQLDKNRPVNEAAAKQIAAKARIAACVIQARELGWQVYEHYSGRTYLWGGAQRPQVIDPSSNLVTTIVKQHARPEGQAPAPWEPDDDLVTVLRMRGYTPAHGTHFAPWVAYSVAGMTDSQYVFWTGTEMIDAVKQAQADIAAQDYRARAMGWESRRTVSTVYFVKGDNRSETCYSWEGAEKLLTTYQLFYQDKVKSIVTIERPKCAICNDYLDTQPEMWHNRRRIHVACKDAAIAEEKAEILQATSQPERAIPDWMRAIPHRTLRLLTMWMTEGEEGADEPIEEVQQQLLITLDTADQDWGDDIDDIADAA